MGLAVILSLWCGLALHMGNCISVIEEEQHFIKSLFLTSSYDPHARPGNQISPDGPTEVTANLYVRSFEAVDVQNMDFTIDMTFRQSWIDPRLQYNSSSVPFLTLPNENLVWKPDTFFRNEKEASFHLVPNKQFYVRVFPDGMVLHSMRIKSTFYCPMDLRTYPFDSQTCRIQIASYGHTKRTLSYKWKDSDPVQMVRDLYLPQNTLNAFKTDYCDVKTATGEYSCLSLEFVFERAYSIHVLTIYIPYIMMVTVSWASFWVKQTDTLARIGINLGMLVMASAKAEKIAEGLPAVAYTKAIDVWTGVCIFFIFSAFAICVLVNWFGKEKKENNENYHPTGKTNLSLTIDYTSRIIFPLLFFIFNVIYWVSWQSDNYACESDVEEQTSCIQIRA
eukprot:GFUD01038888.1.p1 GENE.GFUD01038888.1~~GFUD01038888.1.p1  ORF type:complete len:404 (+),score=52.81 GFUD01038888.1:37-1212(+)